MSDVVARLPDRLVIAAQCSCDAASSKFKLTCVLRDRSFVWSQCCCDVVKTLPDKLRIAAQWASDVMLRLFESEVIAAHCC